MTYKAVLGHIIEEESVKFVKDVLNENNIAYRRCLGYKPRMELDKDNVYWDADVLITLDDLTYIKVVAGGTADDLLGITPSVIWDITKRHTLWMANEETRQCLGIEKFDVA